ncbi:MAG: hypothetical protein AB8B73_00585 [Ekhidna sp.]
MKNKLIASFLMKQNEIQESFIECKIPAFAGMTARIKGMFYPKQNTAEYKNTDHLETHNYG